MMLDEGKRVRKMTPEEEKTVEADLTGVLHRVGEVGRSCIDACGLKEPGVQLSMIEGFLTTCLSMASQGFLRMAAYGEVPVEPGADEQILGIAGRSIDAALDRIFGVGGDASDA